MYCFKSKLRILLNSYKYKSEELTALNISKYLIKKEVVLLSNG